MTEKIDLRIVKTKHNLRHALLSLISEKDFDKLTVTEICDRAMINRMTFYKYYEDKYQLLDELFEELTEGLGSTINKMEPLNGEDALDFLIKILKEVYSFCFKYSKQLYSIAEQSNVQILKTLSRVCLRHIEYIFDDMFKNHNLTISIENIGYFTYGGFAALFFYWLSNKSQYSIKVVNQMLDGLGKRIRDLHIL